MAKRPPADFQVLQKIGKRAGHFKNLDYLLKDVDHRKLTMVIATNIIPAFITDPRAIAPFDDEIVLRILWPPTSGSASDAYYAVHFAYNKKLYQNGLLLLPTHIPRLNLYWHQSESISNGIKLTTHGHRPEIEKHIVSASFTTRSYVADLLSLRTNGWKTSSTNRPHHTDVCENC